MQPRDEEQVEQVVALLREVLEDDLVGAYLFGSAVLGGLKVRSDLDVLAVSGRRTTPEDRQRLASGLLGLSAYHPPDPPRPVELTIVARPDITPWRYPPRREFQYGEWLRKEIERDDLDCVGPTQDHDLALLVTMARDANRPLHGLPPANVLEPVPRDDVRSALSSAVDDVLPGIETGTDTRNGILTLARIWTTLETGAILPKDRAAAWALERLPEEQRPVLERARVAYVGAENESWDDISPDVGLWCDYVVAEIRSAS